MKKARTLDDFFKRSPDAHKSEDVDRIVEILRSAREKWNAKESSMRKPTTKEQESTRQAAANAKRLEQGEELLLEIESVIKSLWDLGAAGRHAAKALHEEAGWLIAEYDHVKDAAARIYSNNLLKDITTEEKED